MSAGATARRCSRPGGVLPCVGVIADQQQPVDTGVGVGYDRAQACRPRLTRVVESDRVHDHGRPGP